ncbi:hypothetical protein C8Q76DRAFT_329303 [Earliella scabrosa]|nr:hypothetical protein C8Q76DRAFT_329303 [Earliella scabrosa]
MPHKRAKRSVREKKRSESGNDIAPGAKRMIENEEIPKSVARVLNAARIQQEYAERKRKAREEEGAGPSRKKRRKDGTAAEGDGHDDGRSHLRIMPGESMAHFNRRVEDAMRHSVKEAIQTSSARMRQVRKEELVESTDARPSAAAKSQSRKGSTKETSESEDDDGRSRQKARKTEDKPKDFEKVSTSAPKRLNDIVQAPPEIKKLPRKAKKLAAQSGLQKGGGTKSLSEGVLSMAQKAMLEGERERAIRLYREMKKGKTSV